MFSIKLIIVSGGKISVVFIFTLIKDDKSLATEFCSEVVELISMYFKSPNSR